MNYHEIIKFWFEEIEPRQQFQKDAAFDEIITSRFSAIHTRVKNCELSSWRETPPGSLAEVIILDQFTRNIFRDRAEAFSNDSLALALAQFAIEKNQDQKLDNRQKAFLYMPFMHSESAKIHQLSVELFSQEGLENNLKFELGHKAIIDRFGRYPHRNAVLGRQSSDEELAFLREPGSTF